MADKPSGVRNFFGRLWDAATPGVQNYNRETGQFMHTGNGLAQVGLRVLGAATGNPLIGTLGPRALAKVANYQDAQPTAVQREGIPVYGAPASAQSAITAPSPLAVNNLGLGAQRPGGSWYGYTGGAGSMGSFGNTQFGNGMASIGQWNPQSVWGQQVAAPTGSNLGLGNNVGGFIGGGSGGGSGQTSGGGMPGIVGGRFAGSNPVDYKRGFITTKKA